jgi:hypothetical protein
VNGGAGESGKSFEGLPRAKFLSTQPHHYFNLEYNRAGQYVYTKPKALMSVHAPDSTFFISPQKVQLQNSCGIASSLHVAQDHPAAEFVARWVRHA